MSITRTVRRVLGVTLAAIVLLGSGPAFGDDHDRGRRPPPRREYRGRHPHRRYRPAPPPVYVAPPTVYAPPPVVYTPPPPSPGINIIFPIHIR